MQESGTPSTSSLLKPLDAEDILIRGERVKYDERRHWAILIQPFLETLAVLVVITILAGTGGGGGPATLLIFVAGAFMVYRLFKGDFSQALTYAVLGGLVLTVLVFNVEGAALLAILLATGRFAYKSMMWLLFERLYITNRRVILAKGFLGASISTMPLTRVTDINYETTIPGEFLGYASLRVETAGQDQALSWLQYLEKPATFYATLIDLSTAAVGSVTEAEAETPLVTSAEVPPPSPETHVGGPDEDDGGGTLTP